MNRLRLLVPLLMLMAATAAAQSVAPAWTLKGFARPKAALYAEAEKTVFVSNMGESRGLADGDGYISRVSADGKLQTLKWVTGLNEPRGLAYAQGRLFVADLDELLEIDVGKAQVTQRYKAAGVRYLNAIALEPHSHFKGQLVRGYVSDTSGNAIWYLGDGGLSRSYTDPALEGPNGLLVEGENLIIAGQGITQRGVGRIKSLPLDGDQLSERFGNAALQGSFDGLIADEHGGYWLSEDSGKLLHVSASGEMRTVVEQLGGVGNPTLLPKQMLLLPVPSVGELRAYALQP